MSLFESNLCRMSFLSCHRQSSLLNNLIGTQAGTQITSLSLNMFELDHSQFFQ